MRVPWETLDDKVNRKAYELALERIVDLENAISAYLVPRHGSRRHLQTRRARGADAQGRQVHSEVGAYFHPRFCLNRRGTNDLAASVPTLLQTS